jgi:uncharacterized protein (DUF2141 family)
MKKRIACLLIFAAAVCFSGEEVSFTAQSSGSLKVTVTGASNNTGSVKIALFNSQKSFEAGKAEPFMKASVSIKSGVSEYVFEGVPYGEYAIMLFHDENDNGKPDMLFGIPREDFAFSNNVAPKFGPPKYSEAKFTFSVSGTDIKIKFASKK